MPQELLDEAMIERPIVKKTRWVNWTAFLLLWAGVGWCILSGFLTYWAFWGAVGTLITTSILFYKQLKQVSILLLGFALLMAAMGLLVFFPISFSIGFIYVLPIDLIPIFVLALLLATNREIYSKLVIAITGNQKRVVSEPKPSKASKFLVPFRKKSTTELRTIVTERRLVPEAVEAAEIILREREVSTS
jgi:hypothetical protein